MTSLGDRIKELREAKSWSQLDLAKAADITQPVIQGLEAGKYQTSRAMPKIANALGVPVWELDPSFLVVAGSANAAGGFGPVRTPNQLKIVAEEFSKAFGVPMEAISRALQADDEISRRAVDPELQPFDDRAVRILARSLAERTYP